MSAVREKWNQRYGARAQAAPATPAFVTEVAPSLRRGSVLDVAAGDGAASLALARLGFRVTAVDIAEVGLARLQAFAAAEQLEIPTHCRDLAQPHCLQQLGSFDNILVCRYKPEATLWPQLAAALVPGGLLAFSTFNLQRHEEHGFPARFCVQPGELAHIHSQLELLHCASVTRGADSFDDYLFRRR
ncbi:class I SAM-dependent methyltransferase [Marinobacterium rhizophilum]|uniref:Methyltransferase domain-containing protein n=1 Tax=Marinobacterium rhizophilum TaxID=420402 RepID=A0ABY5HFR7_9GAMM|nr:methyltransferase domain-containing protein [Marinobacterium rhizophilum]UTW10691.1 methyltransferase domain-containing protein [Marinobacterium rhizophilum]